MLIKVHPGAAIPDVSINWLRRPVNNTTIQKKLPNTQTHTRTQAHTSTHTHTHTHTHSCAEWYRRQMFASQRLAQIAHDKELLEAQARIKAQRALATAQAQAAQRALSVAREKVWVEGVGAAVWL